MSADIETLQAQNNALKLEVKIMKSGISLFDEKISNKKASIWALEQEVAALKLTVAAQSKTLNLYESEL